MDVRRAQWFITWKGGVELQLYNFQLAQSKHRIAAPLVANKPAQSPTRIAPLSRNNMRHPLLLPHRTMVYQWMRGKT
jgi:hypothetical protein